MGSSCSPLRVAQGKDLPPDALERRERVRMLFRRASKNSLSLTHHSDTTKLTTPTSPSFAASQAQQLLPSPGDKTEPLTRVTSGPQEMQDLRPFSMSEGQPTRANMVLEWRNPGKVKGSMEMNEASLK